MYTEIPYITLTCESMKCSVTPELRASLLVIFYFTLVFVGLRQRLSSTFTSVFAYKHIAHTHIHTYIYMNRYTYYVYIET